MNYLMAPQLQKHFFKVPRPTSLFFLKSNWTVTHGPPVAETWTIRARGFTVVGAQEDGVVARLPWASWACRPAAVGLGSILPGPEGRTGNRQLGKCDKKQPAIFFLKNFQVSHTLHKYLLHLKNLLFHDESTPNYAFNLCEVSGKSKTKQK